MVLSELAMWNIIFFSHFLLILKISLQKKDVERTIGIDTDYIETNDFNLETEDKKFLIEVSFLLKKCQIPLEYFLCT